MHGKGASTTNPRLSHEDAAKRLLGDVAESTAGSVPIKVTFPAGALAALRSMGAEIASGGPLGRLLRDQLEDPRHVLFLQDEHPVAASGATDNVIRLQESNFLRDLRAATRAVQQLQSHRGLR